MKFHRSLNGSTGFLGIETYLGPIWFEHRFESKVVADLIDTAIIEGMNTRIKTIREDAYNAGKRAARGGMKVDEFNGCVNSDHIGWTDEYDEVFG